MSRALNCPNCGAPLGMKDVCEYCGTHFIDFTMDTEEPFYIKIRHNGKIMIDRVRLIKLETRWDDPQHLAYDIEGMRGIRVFTAPPKPKYGLELESLGVQSEEIDKFRRGM